MPKYSIIVEVISYSATDLK